jgi:HPt (histidine-containing phosphotransfer) domain-containing protein
MSDSSSQQDLDLTFLYEIADGSNEFIVESIDLLLQQAPELLGSIGESIKSGDWVTAAASAHKLKPSMGFFGMLISQDLLQDIEKLCKAGGQDPDMIAALFSEANEIINNNVMELIRIKTEMENGL